MTREEYKFNYDNNLTSQDEKEVISILVNRLIDALYRPSLGLQFKIDKDRLTQFGIENEPLNWGSLRCFNVMLVIDQWVCTIDEASPNECPTFCAYIERFMAAWGWDNLSVITEW